MFGVVMLRQSIVRVTSIDVLLLIIVSTEQARNKNVAENQLTNEFQTTIKTMTPHLSGLTFHITVRYHTLLPISTQYSNFYVLFIYKHSAVLIFFQSFQERMFLLEWSLLWTLNRTIIKISIVQYALCFIVF